MIGNEHIDNPFTGVGRGGGGGGRKHSLVGFTRIAVNFKFHSWYRNFKLT